MSLYTAITLTLILAFLVYRAIIAEMQRRKWNQEYAVLNDCIKKPHNRSLSVKQTLADLRHLADHAASYDREKLSMLRQEFYRKYWKELQDYYSELRKK